jgi:hypothetical protein
MERKNTIKMANTQEEPEVQEINGQIFLVYSDRVDHVKVDPTTGEFDIIYSKPIVSNTSSAPTSGGTSSVKGTPPYNVQFLAELYKKGFKPKTLKKYYNPDGTINEDAHNIIDVEKDQHQQGKDPIYGNVTPAERAEFKENWKDYFATNPGWDPNDPTTITKGKVQHFQEWVNEKAKKDGLPNYYDPTGKTENISVDDLFGEVVASTSNWDKEKTRAVGTSGTAEGGKKEFSLKAIEPVVNTDAPNKWWLQDKNNLGLAMSNLAGIKRYPPWQATPDTRYAEPTFYDPTRALAANSEMVNQGVQGAGTFGNPQAFAANFSQMQGQGATQAANIIGNYDDRNVGIANEYEQANNQIYNTASREKAGQATNLFDKYTILNQQYDNSKNQAKQQVVQALNQGYTNAAMTQNLNSIYDQYQIDPSSGGNLGWTQGKTMTADNTKSKLEEAGKFAQEWIGKNPGVGASADKLMEMYLKYNA